MENTEQNFENEDETDGVSEVTAFQMYLDELGDIEVFDDVANERYIAEAARGDEVAKLRLIEGNLKNVLAITMDYLDRGVHASDLAQEANTGLVMAVEELSDMDHIPSGREFSSIMNEKAYECIKDALDDQELENKIEQKLLDRVNMLEEASKEMAEELGREPTEAELAERLGITIDEVKDIMKQTMDAMTVTEEYGKPLTEAPMQAARYSMDDLENLVDDDPGTD